MSKLESRIKRLENLNRVKREPEEAIVVSIEGMVEEDGKKIPLEEYKKLHPNKKHIIDIRKSEDKKK